MGNVCSYWNCDEPRQYKIDGYCFSHHKRAARGSDMEYKVGSRTGVHGRRLPNTETERYCTSCSTYQPFANFAKSNRQSTDGYAGSCKECQAWIGIKHRYGLTKDQWLEMFNDQGGQCAVCSQQLDVPRPTKNVVVDHCHTSLKVRGLLCSKCNWAVGFVEAIGGVDGIAVYLQKHGS